MANVYNRLFVSLKQTFQTNYPRIHWTDFHQIYTIWWVYLIVDYRSDPLFSDRSRNVAITTNFAKSADSFSFVRNELEYRNSDFITFNVDDLATACKNRLNQ